MFLFTKHLVKNVLQFGYLSCSESRNSFSKPPLVYCAYLVGSHFAITVHNATAHTIGIAMDGRCNGNYNDCIEMVIQLLGADDDTWTDFLHLGTNSWIEVNPPYIILVYHFQSSIVSSLNTSSAISLSSPS